MKAMSKMADESSTDDRRLKLLQNKLSAIFGRLQQIYDVSLNIDNNPIKIEDFLADSFTVDSLREDFLSTMEERNTYQLSITDSAATVPNYSSMLAFEQLYTKIKYKVHQLSSQMAKNNCRDKVDVNVGRSTKLPCIELCSFDGQIETWPLFYETFKTLIHENPDLSNGEKIHYLLGKLKGKALTICQGILPSAENYIIIWNALLSKYNDKRLLAASYLDKLFNLHFSKEFTPTCLEEFIDKFSSYYSALKQLNFDSLEDFLFIYIACKKVSVDIVKEFELYSNSNKCEPKCTDFIRFVREYSHTLQRAHSVALPTTSFNTKPKQGRTQTRNNDYSFSYSRPKNNYINNVKSFVNVSKANNCCVCGKNDHSFIGNCSKFLVKSPHERYSIIKSNKFCINCLSHEHTILNCKASARCSECGKSHHSLLHFNSDGNKSDSNPAECSPVSLCAIDAYASRAHTVIGKQVNRTVLLGTVCCNAYNSYGELFSLRALVDSASQKDLITIECCERLKLNILKSQNNFVSGVGDINNPILGLTSLTICSRFDKSVRLNIQPMVVNRITNELPTAKVDSSQLEYLKNIMLADEAYSIPGRIDIILGSDVFARILGSNKIIRSINEPVAIETSLGYIVVGQAPVIETGNNIVRTYCTIDELFENRINRFFELEEVPNASNILTEDEQKCENYYCDTTRRDCNGRYIVSLPFRVDSSHLGNSILSAERRFLSLERKLSSNPDLKQGYDSVFKEYLQNNYIQPIGTISEFNSDINQYVIPHHGVVRMNKSTTKLRVVLDGSSPTSTGKSLNDLLYTGPNLQNDLFQIILKFRLQIIALSADIRQMYLRILIDKNYTRFQRLLYRFDPNDPITVFEMTRVPFGLCCSPFLAIRTVRKLAEDERERFPFAAAVAESDIYTDDLATSCASVAQGIELSNQLIGLFAAGGFDMVKFSSNSPEVLKSIPASHRISESVEFSPESQLKILGLHWVPSDDVFVFSVDIERRECTKRNILSTIARLWDLMGFVAPVTLLAKLILKSLWKNNIDWDEIPPSNIITLWQQFEAELPMLQSLKLNRHIGVREGAVVTVLGFADASESAYGGVVYLHLCFPDVDQSVVNLVCAKSKVAPSKTVITLARMELCANLVLSKLMHLVIEAYSSRCTINRVLAFTDSTVALAWIHSCPTRWQTFVANRVSAIHQNLGPQYFHHISGKDNPADCLSRGLLPAQLLEHPLWLNGPKFCTLPFEEWPVHNFNPVASDEIPEEKANILLTSLPGNTTFTSVFEELSNRVSSWPKMLRIVINVLRFVRRLPKMFEISHLDVAEMSIIRDIQYIHFYKDINCLNSGGKLSPALLKLNVFLQNGLLRVGGRLQNSSLNYDQRHPILLPRNNRIVHLIIDYYHKKYLHAGPQLLLSLLRQKFWILSARDIVRKRVHQCNACFRAKPRNEFPLMASLPACRVQEAKAFCHTGVDYAGPIHVLPFRRRGVHSQKAYICLFICLVTKAIHIELASNLSTECFINALRRFVARRGPVSILYSDCGTNFVGARTHLDEMYHLLESTEYRDKFANELREARIDWKFNPASSPHFGGIWESNIKSVKTHLARVVGNQLLTSEEMATTLTQIEAILNSRPLSVLSNDPTEPLALTPAHFLVMTPLKSLPVLNATVNSPLKYRKQLIDQLIQSFWNRWRVEYLSTLQVRNKWTHSSKPIQVGTVVLLKSDCSAPLDWPLGIIKNLFPGKDGIVRVVDVQTRTGIYRRPVVKLYPLPSQ